MQNSKLQFKLKICLILTALFFIASPVFGAEISLNSDSKQIQVGDLFKVDLLINTEEESINALEGEVIFLKNHFDLKEIRDGNSVINFWVAKPKLEDSRVVFSGITPGGFNSQSSLIFSMIFEAKQEGVAKFNISNARVLRNDSTGSSAIFTTESLEIDISKRTQHEITEPPKLIDNEHPESFMPEIAKDSMLFEGKWFVVFVTQDKLSGIDHYEVKESRQWIFSLFKNWVVAESPYVLKDQSLKSYIWVKAVDKAGNERVIKIAPHNPLEWYENYTNWVIIIIVALLIIFKVPKLRRAVKIRLFYKK